MGYYAFVFGLLALMLIKADGKFLPGGFIVQTFFLGAMFGGVKAGGPVKSYRETPNPGEESTVTSLNLNGRSVFTRTYLLDERERSARDYAHYNAYRILLLSISLFMAFIVVTLPWTQHFVERNAITFLWVLIIYALSLPQSVILWTEPEPLTDSTLSLVPAKS